jgi:hypothetical protein
MALVSSRIWFDSVSSCSFCFSSIWTNSHSCWDRTSRFSSARFWLIITNVDRKMASRDTIMVRRPNG